VSKSKSNSTKD